MLIRFETYSDRKYVCARGIGVDIFTQGKTLEELMANLREAVELHFAETLQKGETFRTFSSDDGHISFRKAKIGIDYQK